MNSAGLRAPALTILSHPDVGRVGERAILWDAEAGGEALLARRLLSFSPPGGGRARTLDDPYLSRRPIRLEAARFGGVRIDCSRTGTRVIANDDWISEDRVFLGVEVERGVVLVLAERLSLVLHNFDPQAEDDVPDFGLIGSSSAMLRLKGRVRDLAGTAAPVFVSGEAGSGKKAVARAIHEAGDLERPYLAVRLSEDSPSVPDLLARAEGGTLVLDAAERIEADLQERLLRALEADTTRVRLLATCQESRSRRPAGPLIERLDWSTIDVPALSRRREDLGRLMFFFLRGELELLDAAHRLDDPGPYAAPWLPVRLIAQLAIYEWPGNVRQLRHVARRLARAYNGRDHVDANLGLEALVDGASTRRDSSTGWGWASSDGSPSGGASPAGRLTEIELLSALRTHRWQAEPAAAQLGVSPEALFDLMEEFFSQGQTKSRRNPSPLTSK